MDDYPGRIGIDGPTPKRETAAKSYGRTIDQEPEMAQTQPETTAWTPPYIAFRTLIDLVDRMEREEPPSRIDKSYLDNYSGGYRTQVIAALHSLGLREPDGSLTDRLHDLVKADEATRKELIGKLLHEHYAPVVALGQNATQSQMLDAFKEMGVNPGDTMRKVVAFFLTAAKWAGLPMSKHWKTPASGSSSRKRRESSAGSGGAGITPPVTPDGTEIHETAKGNARTVDLVSGGKVTLTVSVDLFDLTDADREFVLGLVDKLRKYDAAKPLATTSASADDSGGDEDDDLIEGDEIDVIED